MIALQQTARLYKVIATGVVVLCRTKFPALFYQNIFIKSATKNKRNKVSLNSHYFCQQMGKQIFDAFLRMSYKKILNQVS